MTPISKNDYINISDKEPINLQIFNLLKQKIIECQFEPNSSVSENEIANLYNVSRQPVREALIKLQECGLVSINPKKSTRVTKISRLAIYESIVIRESLETNLIKQACSLCTKEHLDTFINLYKQQAVALEQQNFSEFLYYDNLLHQHIILSTNVIRAWDIISSCNYILQRVIYLALKIKVYKGTKYLLYNDKMIKALASANKINAKKELLNYLQEPLKAFDKIIDNCDNSWLCE